MKYLHLITLMSAFAVASTDASISVFVQDEFIKLDGEDTTTFYNGGRDTQLEAGTNADVNFGSLSELSVDSSTRRDALIAFDDIFGDAEGQIGLSDTIISASLAVYSVDASTGVFGLFKVTTAWDDSTATFNNFGATADDGVSADDIDIVPLATVSEPDSLTGVFATLTSAVIDWQADPSSNQGIAILADTSDGWDFGSFENFGFGPVLIVEYTPVPEPASYSIILGLAVSGLLFRRRR